MKFKWLIVVCCLASAAAGSAQQESSDKPPGANTVSGHVYCGDTNAPARMATVVLEPAGIVESIIPGEEQHAVFSGEAVETLLDGSFVIQHVAPGTYYVIASQAGYVFPLAPLYVHGNAASSSEDNSPKNILKSVPRISVGANLPVTVNVIIDRGAVVSGTVLYDDGSPASGIRLSMLIYRKGQWISPPSSPIGKTSFYGQSDDEGHYRISGLPGGDYMLEATLHISKTVYRVDDHGGTSVSMNDVYSLSTYSGGSTRRKDGTPFSVKTGEERSGEDIEIPLTKLHVVRGYIVSAHDGHLLNGGKLSLLSSDDKSVIGQTSLTKDDDAFTFSFVPEGDYILHVEDASDNEYREVPNKSDSWPPTQTETRTIRRYGTADQPIHVASELSGVTVAVPDLPQGSNTSP
ncbi:MAG: hypothetical protein ACLPLZ_11370 [Terracidiphilus sp.]